MNSRSLWGGVLLIAGTTIGAGMLALPVVTAAAGFYPSLVVFSVCWLVMLATAFLYLDVTLAFPEATSLLSLADKTLGKIGKIAGGLFYLLLLYALIAAYIAASAPLFQGICGYLGYPLSAKQAVFALPLLFGGFVYGGTRGVDYTNRLLMGGLVLSYFFLIRYLPAHWEYSFVQHAQWPSMFLAVSVVLTSFGYHIIIPSLAVYMQRDKRQLRWALFLGSCLPFCIYILWQWLVLGVVPWEMFCQSLVSGEDKLATDILARLLNNPHITLGAHLFSFFAIVTSFLGVALSLVDFLSDGLKIRPGHKGKALAFSLTLIPPLIFSYQQGCYTALRYAGIFVAVLLGILPAAMAWRLPHGRFYRTAWGKALLLGVVLFSLGVIVLDILQQRKAL